MIDPQRGNVFPPLPHLTGEKNDTSRRQLGTLFHIAFTVVALFLACFMLFASLFIIYPIMMNTSGSSGRNNLLGALVFSFLFGSYLLFGSIRGLVKFIKDRKENAK
ncbi:MAG: hypothetical protein H8F28_02780 [Fibrella sp.]|nr:hypothetical protein [Armatimonadota bacterium]